MALQGSGAGRQRKPRPGILTLQFTDDDGAHWILKSTTAKKAQFASCDQCKQWLRSPYWPPATLAAMHERGTGHKVDLWAIAKVTSALLIAGEVAP